MIKRIHTQAQELFRYILLTLLPFLTLACNQNPPSVHFPILWGFVIEGFPITKEALEEQFVETKLPAELTLFYLQWPKEANASASDQPLEPCLTAIWENGGLPCLSWEPMYILDGVETTIPYETIVTGQYDGYLISIANKIKSFRKPIIIRFAHEMNLGRYHWGTTAPEYGAASPKIYVKIYQHVVDLFRKQHVDNVLWAFCPNADSVPADSWNMASHYYPGHEYVDILGMDGYNWDLSPELAADLHIGWSSPARSFEQIFSPLFQELNKLAPGKPVIVFETASVDRSGGSKSLWIKQALEVAAKWDLLGIIWFQTNKEEDWRINQNGDYSYLPFVRTATSPAQSWAHKLSAGTK